MHAMPLSKTKFLQTVLDLKPAVAVFDCDGTLWRKDAGTLFLNWSLERQIIAGGKAAWIAERHALYRNGRVAEDVICGEMTRVYAGIRDEEMRMRAREFFHEHIAAHIFAEMLALVKKLAEAGTVLWAVSSTNGWVIEAALEDFGIPADRILATRVATKDGLLTETLLAVPTGEAKRDALRRAGVRGGYAAFGNSVHDAAMLASAQWPFAVNPNPELLALATDRGWPVYWPEVQT
jgi:phosphoserine phosphatase